MEFSPPISELLKPTKPEPNIYCIQDYPGNVFGVRFRVPLVWDHTFKEWKYEDCSHTMLEGWFKKYPHLFAFTNSILPPPESPSLSPLKEVEKEEEKKYEELPCICSQVGNHPGCTPGCTFPKCGRVAVPFPAQALPIEEKEVPQDIMQWIWDQSTIHGKGLDSEYREQAEEDFDAGAKAVYHKMQEVIQMYVDVADDQQKFIDKLQTRISSANARIKELEQQVKDLQDWHDSHM